MEIDTFLPIVDERFDHLLIIDLMLPWFNCSNICYNSKRNDWINAIEFLVSFFLIKDDAP